MQERSGGVSPFFRDVDCNGRTLRVKQLYVGDVGCVVWDAALVLCRYAPEKIYTCLWNTSRNHT